MAHATLQHHVEQLAKPFEHAMQRKAIHLSRLRGLERYVHGHVQALQACALPAAVPPLLREFMQLMEGFDTFDTAQKQVRLYRVQALLAQLRALATDFGPDASLAVDAIPETPAPKSVPPESSDSPASQWFEALTQSVQYLRGVGPKRAALLSKLNLHTVHDLLWCLPSRYEDRRRLTPLGLLQVGRRQTFYGTVRAAQTTPQRRGKPLFTITLEDDSGALLCKWFQTAPRICRTDSRSVRVWLAVAPLS